MSRVTYLGLSLFLINTGCGDAPSGDDESSSGTSEGTTNPTTSDSDSDSADSSTTATTTDGTGGFDPVPARGIAIGWIEVNQGVATTIGTGDQWVPGNNRNARLVKERDTLFRVHHLLDTGWVPRLIEARLTLILPGGETREYSQTKTISANSVETQIDGDFYFGLVAAEGETDPGVQYQISLWDAAPGGEALAASLNVNPASGPAEIGFESVDMEMNIMFVPFTYPSAGTTPDIQDPDIQKILEDQMYQQNPVTAVNAQYHAPVTYNGNFSDVCGMLGTVSQIWQQEGAPSNVYYVGLIDTGAQSGTVGCASLGSNYSCNLWRNNKTDTAETIVHEVGHDQGLSHIACPDGDSAGPDSSYPDHPNGRIMTTGFGVRNFMLYAADTTLDYMSYCTPAWTSDWTWGRVWSRIQQFTAQGDNAPMTPVLHHAIYPDGSEELWTSLARVDPERLSGLHEVEFVLNGEVIHSSPSVVELLSDDKTIWVTTPLPEGGLNANFDLVRDISTDTTQEIGRDQIKFAAVK